MADLESNPFRDVVNESPNPLMITFPPRGELFPSLCLGPDAAGTSITGTRTPRKFSAVCVHGEPGCSIAEVAADCAVCRYAARPDRQAPLA